MDFLKRKAANKDQRPEDTVIDTIGALGHRPRSPKATCLIHTLSV